MCKFHQRRAQASCCVTEDRLGVPSREREMARCTGRFPQTGSSTPQLDMKIGASDRRAERHRIDARRPARGTEATRPVSTNRRTLYATARPTASPRTISQNDSHRPSHAPENQRGHASIAVRLSGYARISK